MKEPDNTCICCGCLIPEGRQICPKCSSEGDCFEQVMSRPVPAQPNFKVDDAVEQAYRRGYAAGYKAAEEKILHCMEVPTRAAAKLVEENEELRRQLREQASQILEEE